MKQTIQLFHAAWRDLSEPELDIPDPDYHEDEDSPPSNGNVYVPKFKNTVLGRSKTVHGTTGPTKNAQGLIEPRKLPNPVLDSREHQDLHRELAMNKKRSVRHLL